MRCSCDAQVDISAKRTGGIGLLSTFSSVWFLEFEDGIIFHMYFADHRKRLGVSINEVKEGH